MAAESADKTSLGTPVGHIDAHGLSVVYDPAGPAVADIVFVHGLQGHPFKTWTSTASPRPAISESMARKMANLIRRARRRIRGTTAPTESGSRSRSSNSSRNSNDRADNQNPVPGTADGAWFWPRDSVPQRCPDARVLTWGYDTHVTRFFVGPSCKGTVLSHGKDLLFSLARSCEETRPLIFVAHSLGGIVVKEMLSASEQSEHPTFRRIVSSTAAVIFLGTPHRGSLDLARLGNIGRAAVGALGFDNNPAALDALALKSSDLERCQESFSQLWRKYDFRVKTFQESLGLSGANIGPLNDQVVPSSSSLLGDAREHAEMLHANHRDMCRYSGPDDSNQARVVGEIAELYRDIRTRIPPLDARRPSSPLMPSQSPARATQIGPQGPPLKELMAIRSSLHFQGIEQSVMATSQAARGTCGWLFQDATFLDWHHRRNVDFHKGLLWLRGNPGSGKTTLMHEACSRLSQGRRGHGASNHVVSFFFNASRPLLSSRPTSLFRSLLYQLFPFRSEDIYKCAKKIIGTDSRGEILESAESWDSCDALRKILTSLLTMPTSPPTVIFIDALDECSSCDNPLCSSYGWARRLDVLAIFFRELTISAHCAGVQLKVCISCRYYGAPPTANSLEIKMEQHNSHDIATYVDLRLSVFPRRADYFEALKRQILEMSRGIFLWVVLAVDLLVQDLEAGKNIRYLEKHLCRLPDGLCDLFRDILRSCQKDLDLRLRFFQWAMLAGNGLQLREWRDILPFLSRPPPRSLEESRDSEYYADTGEQLTKLIRHLSLGLVHVVEKTTASGGEPGSAAGSTSPDAGSLDSAQGDTRIVSPIHDSVREFFLVHDGFSTLSEMPITVQDGGAAIMHTCLDFIEIADLDAIVSARQAAAFAVALAQTSSTPSDPPAAGSEPPSTAASGASSVRSFHSASSSRHSVEAADASRSRYLPRLRLDTVPSWGGSTTPASGAVSIHSPPSASRSHRSARSDEVFRAPQEALTSAADQGRPHLSEDTSAHFFQREEDVVLRTRRLADFFEMYDVAAAAAAAPPPSTLSARASAIAPRKVTEVKAVTATARWEYPDCMPCILAAFLRHTRRVGMDPDGRSDSVFARLLEDRLWRRWLALAEEPDQHETLGNWVQRRGITRWEALARRDRVPDPRLLISSYCFVRS